MKQTLETLRERATDMDRRYASERTIKWVAAVLIVDCMMGGIAAASHKDRPVQKRDVADSEVVIQLADKVLKPHQMLKPPSRHPRQNNVGSKSFARVRPTMTSPIRSKGYTQVYLPTKPEVFSTSSSRLQTTQQSPQAFFDISHPNCDPQTKNNNFKGVVSDNLSLKNVPPVTAEDFAIIGVNGGRNFTSNRCLANELKLPKQYDLYVNSGYPGYNEASIFQNAPTRCADGDRLCVARNYGTQAGRYALQLVKKAGGYAPHEFWIDVETANSWDGSTLEHRTALAGERDALLESNPNVRVGFYSVPDVPPNATKPWRPGMWTRLTGGWQNGADSWIATGINDPNQALEACNNRQSFTGGPVLYSQYTRAFDQNVHCP